MSGIYRKGEVLGWGSFAAVYEGWGELLDRQVAVKELVQPFAGNDPFVRAYLTQARKMVDIAHSHVLATYATDTSRNLPTIIRELADDTLAHRLIEGPRPPEEVVRILRHVLSGLDAIHGRELLHRAVKPENIFLCETGYKIGDFGPVAVEGAPPIPPRHQKYAAPETLTESEREQEGPGSDLYSLGLVAYELFLGPVRLEQTLEELLRQTGAWKDGGGRAGGSGEFLWPSFHLAATELTPLHELDPTIPVALSLTLQKMVRKEKAARFSSCKEVLASLGAAGLIEQPGATQPVRIVREAPAPRASMTRDPRLFWLLGGVAAAVVAGAVWSFEMGGHGWGGRPEGPIAAAGTEAPPFTTAEKPTNAAALRAELRRLAAGRSGLGLELDPPYPGGQIHLGQPMGFHLTTDRHGYLLLFYLDPDGLINCLYPNAKRSATELVPGETLVLPLAQDGFNLTATNPLGKSLVFALRSNRPLPPLPPGDTAQPWATAYPFLPGDPGNPALRFSEWVAGLLRQAPSEVQVTAREIEITR